MKLSEKSAIVTGAAQGIGRAIAERLAADGAAVVVADIDIETARKTAEEIADSAHKTVAALQVDISDRQSVVALFENARKHIGEPNVLVNNAGINVFHDPLEMPDESWDRCMDVDLKGAWHCCREALPGMLARQDGAIINIISNHAFTVIPDTFPYPVAKHGLLGLTRSLALQYAGQGIAINAISPGYTDTRLAQRAFDCTGDPAAARRQVEEKQPVGRLCHPSEIAAIAALLASDEARFMIGENIVIDGGVSIRMYDQKL